MLPAHYKLDSREFSPTIRRGKKAGSRTVVVHVRRLAPEEQMPREGGPHFGFIVSKAVGNAVFRHRVTRRLRHICLHVAPELEADCQVVVRALPPAGSVEYAALAADLHHALQRARRR